MNISITEYEATILKQALSSNIMAKGIVEKIGKAEKLAEEIQNCNHEFGHYKSERECCVKCNALGEGMQEEWILEESK